MYQSDHIILIFKQDTICKTYLPCLPFLAEDIEDIEFTFPGLFCLLPLRGRTTDERENGAVKY